MAPSTASTSVEQQQVCQQMTCNGVLTWEESSDAFNGTCYGVAKPLKGAYVDLVAHDRSRPAPSLGTTVHSLACWGSSAYQHHVDPTTGTIPPPACLGIEFVRHRQAMLQSLHHHPHQQQQELLHADGRASSSSLSDSANSSGTEAYMRHAATSSPVQPSTSTSSPPVVEGPEPEYHGRPSLLQRLQELHAEASERLEGQDPLWFGKAFAARAALNWASMQNMAGQVMESVKADLGLQTKPEEPK